MKFHIPFIIALLMCTGVIAVEYPDTDFQIEINDFLTDNSEKQGDKVNVAVSVENVGESGTQYVECGIFTKEQVLSWGFNPNDYMAIYTPFLGISNVQNCQSNQNNVDTVKIDLDTGKNIDSDDLFLMMDAPYTDPDDEYFIFCDAYKACYGSPDFEEIYNRVTDVDITTFDLEDAGYNTETCSDGIKNQDESDTDCGGRCDDCPYHYQCNYDSDCESNNCVDDVCEDEAEEDDDDNDGGSSNNGDSDSDDSDDNDSDIGSKLNTKEWVDKLKDNLPLAAAVGTIVLGGLLILGALAIPAIFK